MSASIDAGYEVATVTRTARIWSSVLLVVLLTGAFGGALLDYAPLQNWAMRLGAVLLLVGYILISRRSVHEEASRSCAACRAAPGARSRSYSRT